MVKGVTRRVIVVKSPDPRLFEEAIFIVRDAAGSEGVTGEDIVREARDIADRYVRGNLRKGRLEKIPPAVFALAGSALTAILWFLSQYLI